MAPSKNEARLCDSSNCERWWLNADYMHGMGGQRWLKCPYCRRASPKATKFWLGGHAGPKDPSYDYPGRLLPSRLSQERIVLKRPTPVDTSVSSPRPTKAPRSQESTPISTPQSASGVSIAARRDSAQSAPDPPETASNSFPNLEFVLSRTRCLFDAWQTTSGSPDAHKASELAEVQLNIESIKGDRLKIEGALQEQKSALSAAQEALKQRDALWKNVKAAAAEVVDLTSDEEFELLRSAQKPAQIAFEARRRKSEDIADTLIDLQKAEELLKLEQKRADAIMEDKRALKMFGDLYAEYLLK